MASVVDKKKQDSVFHIKIHADNFDLGGSGTIEIPGLMDLLWHCPPLSEVWVNIGHHNHGTVIEGDVHTPFTIAGLYP